MFELFKYHNSLKTGQIENFNKTWIIFLIGYPIVDVLFILLFGFALKNLQNGILSQELIITNSAFPLMLLTAALFRYYILKHLQKIKYHTLLEFSYHIPLEIYKRFTLLPNKLKATYDTKKISNLFAIEIYNLAWRFYVPLIDFTAEMVVILYGLIYLLYQKMYINSAVILLITFAIIIKRIGKQSQCDVKETSEDQIRNQLQPLYTVIDTFKLNSIGLINVNWYESKLNGYISKLQKMQVDNITDTILPRYKLESLVLIILSTFYIGLWGNDIESALVLLLINLRIAYSFAKAYSSKISLQLSIPLIEQFANIFLRLKFEEKNVEIKTDKQLKVERIIFKNFVSGYHNIIRSKEIDNNYYFPSFIRLKGKSGSGKSTLLKTLMGGIKPLQGEFYAEDRAGNKINISERIKFLDQSDVLFPGKLIENISVGRNIDDSLIQKQLSDVGFIQERIDTLLKMTDVNEVLSGGELRRMQLLRMSCDNQLTEQNIVVLDEVDAGLDAENKEKVAKYINKIFANDILFVITHDDNFAELLNITDYIELS